ncbi:uncharacterized protein LOC134812528 isoform X2 [Bolinopsis microptera]|uniref:uncharacterized protein LOC134812528 isoform X2 n=1 Tax=Bolinopsis microptera TaxID=2820187 RepID=UPI00307AED59
MNRTRLASLIASLISDCEIVDEQQIPEEQLTNESYSMVIPGDQPLRKHVLFIVDDYLSTAEKLTIFKSIIKYLETAPDRTLVSLILLSSVVNVYMLGRAQGPVQSEVFSGAMTQDLYKYLTFHARDMICDLTTSRSSLLETVEDICYGLECKSNAIANNSLNKRRTTNRMDKGAPKCLGFMFELLLSILNQDTKLEAVKHMIIFNGGELPQPNLPDSARTEQNKQYFASLGVSLSKTKAAAHLYCLGNAVYGIERMAPLVENCGGSIMWQNVRDISGDMSREIAKCIEKTIGYDCVIRLQTTSNVTLSQIAGATQESSLFTKRYPVLTQDKKFWASFLISSRINTQPIFLQCTNSYTDTVMCAKVTHVSTVRYDCVVDHEEIMCAMCPDTVFALCARHHLQALDQRKENSDALVEQAHQLVTNSETAVQHTVKALIEEYLEKLYFLLHGPIISRMLQQRDLQYYLLHLLSRASVTAVSHLVKAKLYQLSYCTEAGSTELRISEYPPVTLALRSDKAVVLDTMTDIYIWIGSKVQNKKEELLEQAKLFVEQLTADRFPVPSRAVLLDDTASNRFVDCYLMPLHKDSLDMQLSILPELKEISAEDLRQLSYKFQHVTLKSFNQWLEEVRLLVTPSLTYKT